MPTVPFPLVGMSHENRSTKQSIQSTKNLYPVISDGRAQAVLQSFPGFKLFASIATTVVPGFGSIVPKVFRGWSKFIDSSDAEIISMLAGDILFTIDSDGNSSEITFTGTTAEKPAGKNLIGIEHVKASGGTDSIIITIGDQDQSATADMYQYVQGSATFSPVSLTGINQPETVAYINLQTVYGSKEGFVSSTVSDPTTTSSEDFADSESSPDKMKRVYVKEQYVYLISSNSLEVWQNNGTGRPPFIRLANGVLETGIAAPYAVDSIDDRIYFLDNFKIPRVLLGFSIRSIGNSDIVGIFQGLDASDAQVIAMNIDNQNFVIYSFNASNRSFMYCEAVNDWVQLTSGIGDDRVKIGGYLRIFGKHLVVDPDNSDIFELDFDCFDFNREVMIKERITAPVHSALFGAQPNKVVFYDRLELVMESGVGIPGSFTEFYNVKNAASWVDVNAEDGWGTSSASLTRPQQQGTFFGSRFIFRYLAQAAGGLTATQLVDFDDDDLNEIGGILQDGEDYVLELEYAHISGSDAELIFASQFGPIANRVLIETIDSADGLINKVYCPFTFDASTMKFMLFVETGGAGDSEVFFDNITIRQYGKDVSPVVMMSFTDDSGESWSAEQQGEIGEGGQKKLRLEWFQLGDSVERAFKFRISNSVPVTLISLHGDVELEE